MAGTVSKAKNTALICVSLCVILVELDLHFEVGLYLWLDMLYKLKAEISSAAFKYISLSVTIVWK